MLAVQGVDITKVKYVEAGWPTWGTALAGGQGDAALQLGRACGPSGSASELDFEYWLGVQHSPLFANTFVVRAADLDDPDKKAFLDKYLKRLGDGPRIRLPAIRAPRSRRCSSSSRRLPPISGRNWAPPRSCSRSPCSAATCRQAQGLGRPRHGCVADLLRQDL